MSFSLATSAAAYICVRDCMWVVSTSIFGLAAERGSTDRLDTTGKDVQNGHAMPRERGRITSNIDSSLDHCHNEHTEYSTVHRRRVMTIVGAVS